MGRFGSQTGAAVLTTPPSALSLPRFYLEDPAGKPRPVFDIRTWAHGYHLANNVVAVNQFKLNPDEDDYRVETVFTGVVADQAQFPPELYSTFVLYGIHLEDQISSPTREDAEETHNACVRDIQSGRFF